MLEIELEYLMLKEFSAKTHIAEGYTSLCLLIYQQPSVILDQNEGSTCIFVARS